MKPVYIKTKNLFFSGEAIKTKQPIRKVSPSYKVDRPSFATGTKSQTAQ